jgi:hypothetical protein
MRILSAFLPYETSKCNDERVLDLRRVFEPKVTTSST